MQGREVVLDCPELSQRRTAVAFLKGAFLTLLVIQATRLGKEGLCKNPHS